MVMEVVVMVTTVTVFATVASSVALVGLHLFFFFLDYGKNLIENCESESKRNDL